MSQPIFTITPLEPGAAERVAKGLSTHERVKSERPCKECVHYNKNKRIHCSQKCNFNHDNFKRDETESRRKPS